MLSLCHLHRDSQRCQMLCVLHLPKPENQDQSFPSDVSSYVSQSILLTVPYGSDFANFKQCRLSVITL